MLLKDRVAIVSGIGPGLGREIALALAREGADLALGARTEERLVEVAAEVEAMGRRAVYAPTDVTDEVQCARLVETTVGAFGRVDVLINNAFMQPPMVRVADDTTENWRKAFEVNAFGPLQLTRAAIPAMREHGAGSIVFVASMSVRNADEKLGAYSASKAAVLSAAKTLARELGPDGIRVNSVLPGYVWGPNLQWWFDHLATKQGRTQQEVYDEVAAGTAMRHLPTSAEVADAIVFFASDLSRVVTGAVLDVNAGHWMP